MTVAELDVLLQVKGSAAANRALEGVDSGLKDIWSTSIATKAAILAAVYAVERLTTGAAKDGAELVALSTILQTTPAKLQAVTLALQPFNVSAQEVSASLLSLQSAVAKMVFNKDAPAYFKLFTAAVGGLDKDKLMGPDGPLYFLEKLHEFSKMGQPLVMRELLEGMHISPNLFQALERLSPDKKLDSLKGMNVLLNSQYTELDKVNAAWLKFGSDFDTVIKKLTANHGESLMKAIEAFIATVDALARGVEILSLLVDKILNLVGAGGKALLGQTNFKYLVEPQSKTDRDWHPPMAPRTTPVSMGMGMVVNMPVTYTGPADATRKVGKTLKDAVKKVSANSFARTQGN